MEDYGGQPNLTARVSPTSLPGLRGGGRKVNNDAAFGLTDALHSIAVSSSLSLSSHRKTSTTTTTTTTASSSSTSLSLSSGEGGTEPPPPALVVSNPEARVSPTRSSTAASTAGGAYPINNDTTCPPPRPAVFIQEEEGGVAAVINLPVVPTARASGGWVEAIDEAFDAMLRATTGRADASDRRRRRLERPDLVALLRAAARHTGLDLRRSAMEEAADALILDARYAAGGEEEEEDEDLEAGGGGGVGGGEDGGITREQFHDIFARNPDMLAVFEDDDDGDAIDASAASSGIKYPRRGGSASSSRAIRADAEGGLDESHEEEEEEDQIWVTHWKNRRLKMTWIILYLIANAIAFAHKATAYAHRDEALAVFGGCIVVARGCAAALNLNAFLVLLLSCKHLTTLLRRTRLRFYFPFDASREAHVAIGAAFGLLAASHTAAHVCDFDRMARNASEADLDALFGEEVARGIPESPAGRWAYMVGSRARLVATSEEGDRRRRRWRFRLRAGDRGASPATARSTRQSHVRRAAEIEAIDTPALGARGGGDRGREQRREGPVRGVAQGHHDAGHDRH